MKLSRHALTIVTFLGLAVFSFYILTHSRMFFGRRAIAGEQHYILSYGPAAPLLVVVLIVLSTIIPPLPLPVPIIEIAAGLVFGFIPGALLVWFSQIVSSVMAFLIVRLIKYKMLKKLTKTETFSTYKKYVQKKGPWAVVLARATMISPFNIISFVAGLTQMSVVSFSVATAVGTIPESLLFPFLGSLLVSTQIPSRFIAYTIVGLTSIGLIAAMVITHKIRQQLFTEEKKVLE